MKIKPELKPKNIDNFILQTNINYINKPNLSGSLKSSVGSIKKLN
jgi:hypothetical protein